MVKTLIALTPYLAMWHMEQNLRADLSHWRKGYHSIVPSVKLIKDGVLGLLFPSWLWEIIVLIV